MKISIILLLFGLICGILLNSCEEDSNTGFSIEFSNGTILDEDDIAFYDSSTCILFLKEELSIIVGTGEPRDSCTEFSVFINNVLIYGGVIYPDFNNNFSAPTQIYISSKTYPILESKILPLKGFKRIPNDPRIIKVLDDSNLLKHGITCTIDNVELSPENDTIAFFTITYKNHDRLNYYVPDPNKMGPVFNSISNIALYKEEDITGIYGTSKFWITSSWNFTMDDLSILESHDELTYTFTVSFNETIEKGVYDCYCNLNNNVHFLPFPIPLDQKDGRVWVGYFYSSAENLMIN